MSLPVDKATPMEEGSSGVGRSGNTEQFLKDRNMPDGDACRPDGTLKDASELSFPNSPSDATINLPDIGDKDIYFFRNLKRAHDDSDEEESSSESTSDGHPKTKVSHISIAFISLENLLMLKFKQRSNRVLDSDDEMETEMETVAGPQSSKGQRKVSIIAPYIIIYLPLFN
jgi:hypothetical protein